MGDTLFKGNCGIFALALVDVFSDNLRDIRLVEVYEIRADKRQSHIHFAAKFGNFIFDGNGLIDEEMLIESWTPPKPVFKIKLLHHKIDRDSLIYIQESTRHSIDYDEMTRAIKAARREAKTRLRDRYST